MSGKIGSASAPYIYIRDEKASGTDGGTFTSGAWRTRDLNTKVSDASGLATLAANQITLPPGTYRVKARAPVGNQVGSSTAVGAHKCRLQNITAGTTIVDGSSERVQLDNAATQKASGCSVIAGRFTLAVASVLELQHSCGATATTTGYGHAVGIAAVNEVFSEIEFWKDA